MNPHVSTTSVPSSAATLVFSGTGSVRLSGDDVRFGDSNVSSASALSWLDTTQVFHFVAPAEIYAVCINGQTNRTAKVERWY